MAREKYVDMPRRGNFKGGFGQSSATGKAKNKTVTKKKAPNRVTAEKVKKMKQKESVTPKPKPKPAMVEQKKKPIRTRLTDVNSPSRSTTGKVTPKKPQSRSGSMVLGQGPKSPALEKFKRTSAYGRK